MEAMGRDQKSLLHSMIDSIALAMDRFRASEQRIKSREEVSKERYRANLLRSISHDIRTPLAGIIGSSEILRDSLDPGGEPYRIAGRIQTDAEWLHSLVENIMGLTRLQDGGVKLKKEWEAVEEIIGVAVGHVEQHWPEREIDVRLPEEVLMAPMDAKLIEQVNINLLENAIKHSKDDGPVTITASQDQTAHCVVVTVRDCGEGIRPRDLPHIFQPFYTSGRSESTRERSFGLGLAICETIVQAHGGTIEARNSAEGPGAEFTYTIPMEEQDDTKE
jgi:two-component system sensor histidine kinase KdpD